MNNKNGEYIMRDPTKSEEFKQMILERMLDDLCKLTDRDIFIMLPENKDERIPYIKKEIIKESKGANNSYAVNLITGKVRVTKSKKLRSFLLDKKKFSNLDIQTKKKLVRNKVVKLSYLINTETYQKLLDENLVDNELKEIVEEKKRQPFYISIILNKNVLKEVKKENEFEEIVEAAESDDSDENELDPGEEMFIQSVFSDDDPADMLENEKEEKGLR